MHQRLMFCIYMIGEEMNTDLNLTSTKTASDYGKCPSTNNFKIETSKGSLSLPPSLGYKKLHRHSPGNFQNFRRWTSQFLSTAEECIIHLPILLQMPMHQLFVLSRLVCLHCFRWQWPWVQPHRVRRAGPAEPDSDPAHLALLNM